MRDWPAFAVRGFMHDVGRNFQSVAELKPQIERFAQYKLNTFHWHLSDNPGWRIESRGYPQLNDGRSQTRDVGRFPFVKSTQVRWKVVGPFLRDKQTPGAFAFDPEREVRPTYQQDGRTLAWADAVGGTVHLGGRGEPGLFTGKQQVSTAYALASLDVDADRTVRAWVGFETPTRSNRECGGILPAAQWDAFGAAVFVNGQPVPPPAWQHPGAHRHLSPTWSSPANEVPYADEAFFWTRPPASVPLHKGRNTMLIRVPCGYVDQNWDFTFVPVRDDGRRWVEDETVRFAADGPAVSAG